MEEHEIILHGECHLLNADDEVVKNKIYSGYFIILRRKFWSFVIISKKHPHTCLYYDSDLARKAEERRQLIICRHLVLIHPFSLCSFYWEHFMFFAYLYMLMIYTLSDFHKDFDYRTIEKLKVIGDSVYLLDMIHFFIKGYYNTERYKTVLNFWKIASKYVTTWFFFDLIAMVPSLVIIQGWLIQSEYKYPVIIEALGMVRLCRIFRWLSVVDLFQSHFRYSHHIFMTLKVLLIYLICLCFAYFCINSIFFEISDITHEIFVVNAESYLIATMAILLVSIEEAEWTSLAVAFIIMILIAGFLLQLSLFIQIFRIWNIFMVKKNKVVSNFKGIQFYLSSRGVSKETQERANQLFDFNLQTRCFNIQSINNLVSDVLRHRITFHLFKKHLGNCFIVQKLPNKVLMRVIQKTKSEMFLPEEVILTTRGNVNKGNIFFIYYGTVVAYDEDGAEVCYLEDGDNFGEGEGFFPNLDVKCVKAASICELFSIERSDLYAILNEYPELQELKNQLT